MKDQPGLIEQMRRTQREEWDRVSTTRSVVPMHDFVTHAEGEDYRKKMESGEWDDLTRQVAKHLSPEQLKPGVHIVGHRYTGNRYDPSK